MTLKRIFSRTAPAALAMLGCVGVIGTGVASAKAAKRAVLAEESGVSNETWKEYLPACGIAAVTIGCIAGAYILNKKQQGVMLAGQLALAQSYGKYKQAVLKRYGEQEALRIDESIAIERCEDVSIFAPSIGGANSLDVPEETGSILFQEEAGGRIFESTLKKVIEAEYHLNRNYVFRGEAGLDEFYNFLGLRPDERTRRIGWSTEDGIYWLDFNHRVERLKNGQMGCIIEYAFSPVEGYSEFDY